MTPEPVVVTDDAVKAVASGFGLGRHWRTLRDEMVAAGAWITAETKTA